ncbi:hypothetical protein DFH09DRAFT_1319744 [Mycena vulgaris]|nr:hypothetical protein DFH09DRAFT_1319744 [Mycena vulgaris]
MSVADNYPIHWRETAVGAVHELLDASQTHPGNVLESIKSTNDWDGDFFLDASSEWRRPSYDQLLGHDPEASFAWVTPGEPEPMLQSKQRALTRPMAGYHLPMAIPEASPFPSPSPSPASSVTCDSSTESETEEDPLCSDDDCNYVYEREEDHHFVDYRHPSQSAYPDSELGDFDYNPFNDSSSSSLAGVHESVSQSAYPDSELGDFDYGAFTDSASGSSFNHDVSPIGFQDAVDEDVLDVPEEEYKSPLDTLSSAEAKIPTVVPAPPLRITIAARSSLRTMAPLPKRRASSPSAPAHPPLSSDFTFGNPISKQEESEDDNDDDTDSDYEDAPSGARRGRMRSGTTTKRQLSKHEPKAQTVPKPKQRQRKYHARSKVYTCKAPGCTRSFATTGGRGRHYDADHLGLTSEMPTTEKCEGTKEDKERCIASIDALNKKAAGS